MYDDDMDDEELGEILDDVQDSLFQPAEWSWTFWVSGQLDCIGDIADTVGKMMHDTTIQMRQHFRFKQERKYMIDDSLHEIRQLTGE